MRSTPWPNDTLRTVNVARAPPRCMPITMPSNTWMRSLSPSRTFTCTFTVSPGLIAGRCVSCPRSTFSTAFMTCLSFSDYPTGPGGAARALERLLPPPFLDLRVVPGQQHRRDPQPAELRGPRVLREVQQPVARERVAADRRLVPDHSRDQPRHRVHDHQRRQLAARQHVIPDRDRLGRQVLPDALVDPFVPPAQDHQVIQRAQPLRDRVRQPLAVG